MLKHVLTYVRPAPSPKPNTVIKSFENSCLHDTYIVETSPRPSKFMCPYSISRLEGVNLDGVDYDCNQLNDLCKDLFQKYESDKDEYRRVPRYCCSTTRSRFNEACPEEMKAFRDENAAVCNA